MRDGFIRLTKISNPVSGSEEIVLNPNKFQLGRSIYLCKSDRCINLAIKEKKIQKMLRVSLKSLEKIILTLEEFSKLNPQSSILSSRKVVLAK